MSRRLLQAANAAIGIATVVLGSIQLALGVASPVYGDLVLPSSPALDSNLRFFGGLGLGLGLILLWTLPRIERQTTVFGAVWACTFGGGVGRALSWLAIGTPPAPMAAFTLVEVVGAPLMILWQRRLVPDA
jgi:hypothetical protein